MTGAPQEYVLGPVLFNISINDIEKETKLTLRKFADDPNLRHAVETPQA